ncbi:hypothetical protein AVEN_268348-1 [Araneus ventricosus]|uniref:Uncharacterized protein n=1 Tax=Araneus ventricosus TaxID=182803 RepID=A0A4Y2MTP3_ARAVE|nr:hypothetical protein AVEN_268348-1 [Araneus ventricosus]
MSTQGLPPEPVMADVNFTSGNFRPPKMLYMSVVITRWSAHSPNSRCYVDKQRDNKLHQNPVRPKKHFNRSVEYVTTFPKFTCRLKGAGFS